MKACFLQLTSSPTANSFTTAGATVTGETGPYGLVEKFFMGLIDWVVTCHSCKNVSTRREHFNHIGKCCWRDNRSLWSIPNPRSSFRFVAAMF